MKHLQSWSGSKSAFRERLAAADRYLELVVLLPIDESITSACWGIAPSRGKLVGMRSPRSRVPAAC